MNPRKLIIYIDDPSSHLLNEKQIEFCFKSICKYIGCAWKFISTNELENYKNIDIAYTSNKSIKTKLSILPFTAFNNINDLNPISIEYEMGLPFILFTKEKKNIIKENSNQLIIKNDIILSIFYFITGEYDKKLTRDKKNRIEFLNDTILSKHNLKSKPIFNIYSNFLKDKLKIEEFIPQWPNNKKYGVILSHDVDYPEMIKWIEILRYLVKYRLNSSFSKIIDIIKSKEPFFLFKKWIELEKKHNCKSVFYFSGLKRGSLFKYIFKDPDTFYDINKNKYKNIFNTITDEGFEIGIHTSYNAYKDIRLIKEEKINIEKNSGIKISGNRHHYWNFNQNDPLKSMNLLYDSGLIYDSSIAFSKNYGFRYSICSPFKFYDEKKSKDSEILQFPVTIMDDHLFNYNKKNENPRKLITTLIDIVRKNNGILVIDFHVRVLNNTFFPNWGKAYKYILEKINEQNDYYCDTPINIANYWLKREIELENLSK